MILRQQAKKIVEGTDTRLARIFDWLVQGLIVVSLAAFAVETLPDLSEATRAYLRLSEIATVFLFTVEYLLRIWVAERPTRFVFSFFGVIDLVAILPFYIATGLDLRSVRAVRLMRLFRLLKLARYSAAIRRFRIAFRLAREELVLFLCGSGILLYLSAFGIYYFEHDVQPEVFASVFDALWWAVATLTTVGYGDVYPVTAGGKLFTAGVLFVGLGIVAVPAGLVAASLSQARVLDKDMDESA